MQWTQQDNQGSRSRQEYSCVKRGNIIIHWVQISNHHKVSEHGISKTFPSLNARFLWKRFRYECWGVAGSFLTLLRPLQNWIPNERKKKTYKHFHPEIVKMIKHFCCECYIARPMNFILYYFLSVQYLTREDPGRHATQQVASVEKTIAFQEKVLK